jgi:hypothetical protein
MNTFRADLALLGLAVVGVLSDLACVLTGHTPPGLFEQVALAGLTGAAGVAQIVPGTAQTPASVPAPAAAVPEASPVADFSGPVGQ